MGEANRAQRRTAISALTKEARPGEPRVRAPDVILNPTTPVHFISDRRSTPGQLAHADTMRLRTSACGFDFRWN